MSAYLFIQSKRKIAEKFEFIEMYRVAKGGKAADKRVGRWARDIEVVLTPSED